jgi:hypothetical protein
MRQDEMGSGAWKGKHVEEGRLDRKDDAGGEKGERGSSLARVSRSEQVLEQHDPATESTSESR